MKTFFLNVICFLFLSFSVIGQDTTSLNVFRAVKYQVNMGFNSITLNQEPSLFVSTHAFISPGISFYWRNEHRYWEIGLADFYYKRGESEAGFKENYLFTSIRAERGWRWGKKEKPLHFFLGYAIQPTFQRHNFIPTTSNFFASQSSSVGFRGQFVPKLSYRLSNDFVLDFTVLLLVSDINIGRTRTQNPSLTEDEQLQFNFDSRLALVNRELLRDNLGLRISFGKIF